MLDPEVLGSASKYTHTVMAYMGQIWFWFYIYKQKQKLMRRYEEHPLKDSCSVCLMLKKWISVAVSWKGAQLKCLCVQVAISQWQLPQEDPRWPDQRVIFWLQQFRHGGPLRPPALPSQTQTEGTSPDALLHLESGCVEASRDKVWLRNIKQSKMSQGFVAELL